jgi:hypothetical protein
MSAERNPPQYYDPLINRVLAVYRFSHTYASNRNLIFHGILVLVNTACAGGYVPSGAQTQSHDAEGLRSEVLCANPYNLKPAHP